MKKNEETRFLAEIWSLGVSPTNFFQSRLKSYCNFEKKYYNNDRINLPDLKPDRKGINGK